ncbi:MAG: phosphoribosylformylglycinamidine cyclo-ligase [Scrofimicrobium sp.]
MSNAYAQSGVDVEAGYEVVRRIKKHAKRTERPGVMGGLGGFGGCFDLASLGLKDPILVSGTDGVGTKLLVAIATGKHDTVGIDCVAMCVNDIVAQGAQPLYFLDYVATGKNDPAQIEAIVSGVAEGCVQAGAALVGGETAEMPGMYADGDYDLAGFAVGACERDQLVDASTVKEGDVLVGLPSSGVHSNGFSLVRKVLDQAGKSFADTVPELGDATIGEVLLTPTRIYVSAVLPLVQKNLVRGISHVTGGGFDENIPRMIPEGLSAAIDLGSWPVPPIFSIIQNLGGIDPAEMYQVFNMGLGMVLAVRPGDLDAVVASLSSRDEEFYRVGEVVAAACNAADAPVIYRGSFE